MKHPALRMVALLAGLAMIVAAIVIATRTVDFTPFAAAPWWLLPAMAGCVVANQTLASMLVCIQTASFDCDSPITHKRMWQLTAASRLLNFLPMQAGLLGRATFMHLRHGMPARQAGVSLLVTFVYGAATVIPLGLAALFAPDAWRGPALVALAGAFVVGYPVTQWVARVLLRRKMVLVWAWAPLRLADLGINALKMWLAFDALGVQLTFTEALGLKTVGVLIEMLGLTPHGLGLREWAIAAVTRVAAIATAPQALAATLIERGVDALLTVVMGLIGLSALRHVAPVCDGRRERQ